MRYSERELYYDIFNHDFYAVRPGSYTEFG